MLFLVSHTKIYAEAIKGGWLFPYLFFLLSPFFSLLSISNLFVLGANLWLLEVNVGGQVARQNFPFGMKCKCLFLPFPPSFPLCHLTSFRVG